MVCFAPERLSNNLISISLNTSAHDVGESRIPELLVFWPGPVLHWKIGSTDTTDCYLWQEANAKLADQRPVEYSPCLGLLDL